ncbi:MAG TPA: hypothetical protein VMS64_01850 [Candidatus Methylomirabilis sp.]|nr:hypothetical protein [Candidatus Methylomirabilis sp.]
MQIYDDAGTVLAKAGDGSVDLVFLDFEPPEYLYLGRQVLCLRL